LYLVNNEKIIRNIELYDFTGRLLKSATADTHQTSVNVKELSKGFLFVKVIYDDGSSEVMRCVVY